MESTSFAPRALAELRTLGVTGLQVDGTPRLERRRKSLALLAFLARHAPARLRRADLAPLLWPTSPEERARQSLRQALAELRNAIGDALQSTAEHAWIDSAALALDIDALERDMDAGRLGDALARHTGTFLDGYDGVGGEPFDLWLAGERERLQARVAWLTEQVARSSTGATRRSEPPHDPPSATMRTSRRHATPTAPLISAVPLATSMHQDELLHALSAAWNRACQGGAEAVLVEGDAGLGKSHVLEQFVRLARVEQPQSVALVARALESERRQPASLTRHLLDLAPPKATASSPESEADATRLREAAARIAGVVPLLVVVDDATLADDVSQDALGALIQSPPAGALVVIAARPFMLSDVRFRGALQRNAALRRLSLTRMPAASVPAMLGSLLPLEGSLLATLAERLGDERRGNPALIEATLASMVDDGYLAPGSDGTWRLARELPARLPITSDVRERTRRVTPRLSADARLVLDAAAVPGDAVDRALLGMAAELDANALDAALLELTARRLLRPSMRGESWLEFTSGAVRHAVLDQMGLPRRRALQRAHERALRHRHGAKARDRITYAEAPRDRSALAFLRSTFAAAAGLLS